VSTTPMMPEPAEALRRPLRRFPALAAALICSLAFFLLCAAYTGAAPEETEKPKRAAASFVQLVPQGAGDVLSITLTQGDTGFELRMQNGAYALSGETAAVDPQAARELLSAGASILSRQQLSGNPADYGAGEGALRASFAYESGETLTLLLGDPVPTGEGHYAAVNGQVHVVNNALAAALQRDKQALYALPDLSQRFTANTLMRASIALPGEDVLTLERVTHANPFNTKVQMTSPIRYPANAERAAEVYLALENIRPTGVAQIGGRDEDWGLDAPLDVLTLTDKEETTLTLGRAGDLYTLRIGGDKNVYTVDGAGLSFLDAISVPYLAEQLPGLVMLNQVASIAVHTQAETLAFTVDPGTDTYTIDGKPLTRDVFVPAYQQMIGLLIERYAPGAQAGDARIRIEYTLTNGSRFEIVFAEYDEQFDLVVREDCASFLISRAKTDAMVDALRSLK